MFKTKWLSSTGLREEFNQSSKPFADRLVKDLVEKGRRADGGVEPRFIGETLCSATIRMGRIIICDQMNRPQKWLETMSEWSYSPV